MNDIRVKQECHACESSRVDLEFEQVTILIRDTGFEIAVPVLHCYGCGLGTHLFLYPYSSKDE